MEIKNWDNGITEMGLDAFVQRYSAGALPKIWALEAVVAALIELHPRKSELAVEIPRTMARMLDRLNRLPLNPEGHSELAKVLNQQVESWIRDVAEETEAKAS